MRFPFSATGFAGLAGGFGLLAAPVVFATSSPPPTVHWVSEPAAGLSPWLQAIAQTPRGSTIDWNAYLFTAHTLRDALTTAVHRGVRVRVLLDRAPYDVAPAAVQADANALRSAGLTVRWAPPRFTGRYRFDHAKYAVFGVGSAHSEALLGSPNATASAFDGGNAEDAVETTSPAIVHALTAVFHADWTRQPAGSVPRRVLMLSPGDTAPVIRQLSAPGLWRLAVEELDPPAGVLRVLARHARHHHLDLLVPNTLSAGNRAVADQLARLGAQVRYLATPYLHAKLWIGPRRVFVGSQNLSTVSLADNREVGLWSTAPALRAAALQTWTRWWQAATPTPQTTHWTGWDPLGASEAAVSAHDGPPAYTYTDTYDGTRQTVWVYPPHHLYFAHGRLVYRSG